MKSNYKRLAVSMIVVVLFVALSAIIYAGRSTPAADKAVDQHICMQPGITGWCDEDITGWYFDSTNMKCIEFMWGGCGGNIPFYTMEECEQRCLG